MSNIYYHYMLRTESHPQKVVSNFITVIGNS